MMIAALLVLAASAENGLPPIRAIPTGRVRRRKFRKFSLAAVMGRAAARRRPGQMKNDAKVSALVAKLAARRTPLDEAEKTIAEFLSGAAATEKAGRQASVRRLFDTLNAQRSSVMGGSNA